MAFFFHSLYTPAAREAPGSYPGSYPGIDVNRATHDSVPRWNWKTVVLWRTQAATGVPEGAPGSTRGAGVTTAAEAGGGRVPARKRQRPASLADYYVYDELPGEEPTCLDPRCAVHVRGPTGGASAYPCNTRARQSSDEPPSAPAIDADASTFSPPSSTSSFSSRPHPSPASPSPASWRWVRKWRAGHRVLRLDHDRLARAVNLGTFRSISLKPPPSRRRL